MPRRGEWVLGKPDMLVRLKEEQEIPATGPDQFRSLDADQITAEDLWVKAVEIKPNDSAETVKLLRL